MDRDANGRGPEQGIDWLEVPHDLPHLFARLSELVHAEGHAPEDLVVIPRSELDRRETAAFTAGWAEAMAEDLPRIRREYEKRVVDAYAAGGEAGRGGPNARRGANTGTNTGAGAGPDGAGRHGEGAEVIRLPFALLLDPPALVTEAEDRIRRARQPVGVGRQPGAEQPRDQQPRDQQTGDQQTGDRQPDADHEQATAEEPAAEEPRAHEQSGSGAPPSAQEVRDKRAAPAGRKVVRRRGRPIVPPLRTIPVQPRAQAPSAESPADGPERAEADGRRSLAQKARALAQELEARGGGRPEPAGDGRRTGEPSPSPSPSPE
ncbi:hypothetical protein [Streptomyces sp. G1]|uniref:hypothetical protein n=1 Tax=Streptomyces sp. G1 TaxID=361572 RepID=UPI00202DCF61|nr:hypothetical protein [Streptomyces sp. G1]MCM1977220.1 hypothetical protein [Streptomyces sp. G1]